MLTQDPGYLVHRAVFTPDEVAHMREAFDRLLATADGLGPGPRKRMVGDTQFVVDHMPKGPNRIHRMVWVAGSEPVLDRFGRDARLVRPAAEMLSTQAVDQLICQAHPKRSGDQVSFGWHQDSSNRRHGTEFFRDTVGDGGFVQCLTALDRMDRSNGGLAVVPNSHHWGHMGPHTVSLDGLEEPVWLTLEPGDVVWWGAFLVHGSAPNTSGASRRAFVNGYARPGANRRIYPGVGRGRTIRA